LGRLIGPAVGPAMNARSPARHLHLSALSGPRSHQKKCEQTGKNDMDYDPGRDGHSGPKLHGSEDNEQ